MTTKSPILAFLIAVLVVAASIGICRAQNFDCGNVTTGNKCLVLLKQGYDKVDVASEQQMNRICTVMKDGLACVDALYRQCRNEERNSLSGPNAHYFMKLCDDKEYRKEYLKHATCHYHSINACEHHLSSTEEFVTSGIKPGTTTQDLKKTLDKMCRGSFNYIDCVRTESRTKCDREAFLFISEYELSAVKQLQKDCNQEVYKIEVSAATPSPQNSLAMCVLSMLAFLSFKRFSTSL